MNISKPVNMVGDGIEAVGDGVNAIGVKAAQATAAVVFGTRWFLAPLSIGLSVAIGVYVVKFAQQTQHLVMNCLTMNNEEVLLDVLEMIDSMMVANLVAMTLIGSYAIFIDKRAFDNFKNRPTWLKGIDSTSLKINIGKSLMGVSSVSLLKTFMEINHSHTTWDHVWMSVLLHMVFCVTTLFYAIVHRVQHSATDHSDDSHDQASMASVIPVLAETVHPKH